MKDIYKMLTSIFLVSMLVTITTVITVGIADAVPIEEWNKTYSQHKYPGYSNFVSAQQTSDGGYISAGIYKSDTNCSSVGLIVKTDRYGYKQWNKFYGDPDAITCIPNGFSSVQQATDGGYIVAGYIFSGYAPGSNALLMKIDNNGNEIWNKTFGGNGWYVSNSDCASSVQQTKDGGYILAGGTYSYTDYAYAWLIKTDSYGNEKWSKKFGDMYNDFAMNVQQTIDGGYVFTGTAYWYGSDNSVTLLIKTDNDGNEKWNKTFGAMKSDASNVRQTTDGGYILAGHTASTEQHSSDAWLIKTDNDGNILWEKTFGEIHNDYANDVQQTTDGGYVLAGFTSYDIYNQDAWLIKTNSNGNKLWNKTFVKSVANSVRQTIDGGYIVAGSKSEPPNSSIGWLVKLNQDIQPNLLKNSGFEESYNITPKYWTKYQTGYKAVFTYPETGRTNTGKSVAIKYTTKETGKVALWWQQSIPIIPSKQYKLSGYMKLSNVTGGRAGLRINWYKSDGNIIKIDLITKSGTSGWTKYETTFTAPSNAVKATVGGDLFNSSGKVWFDDLSLVRTS